MNEIDQGRLALFTGGIAAILASTCCLGPLVLVTLGFSGAWISNLTVLESYRPLFVIASLFALFVAWRRISRFTAHCQPGQVCAAPHVNRSYRLLFWLVTALVVIALIYPFVLPLFY